MPRPTSAEGLAAQTVVHHLKLCWPDVDLKRRVMLLRDTKNGDARGVPLSSAALVAAAEKGRPTLVSRHGRPCAMIVPVADSARLYPLEMPNLANYLLALPEPLEALETERDTTPLRGVDFD